MKTILVDALGTLVIEGNGVYRPLLDLLEEYPNRKIILTNANDEQTIEFGFTDLPYELFTLKHNPDKDDPKYFENMLHYFDLGSEDVIYFEHNPDAVKSAQSVGITTHFYDSDKKDIVSLAEFIDKNI